MADLTFRFGETGADKLASGMRKVADAETLAARGARLAADAIEKQRKAAATSVGATLALAKADDILKEAEHGLAEGALEAEFALKREADAEKQAARDALEAAAANRTLADSFSNVADKAGGFSLKGSLASLTPALIPLAGGVAAGVAAIGVSFGAAAVGAGLFGALAKSVFGNVSKDNQKLQTAQKQLAAAQIARAQATTKAQRKAADNQIFAAQDTIAAIRSEGAAYNQVLDLSKEVSTKWKVASAQIASPALVPWLSAVSKGIGFIRPLVQPVADQFRSWGQAVDRYFSSSRGSAEIRRIAAAFGAFSADQLSALGVFFTDIGKAVLNLGRDLAGHNVDFGAFSVYLDRWGGAFLRWSQSSAARQDVTRFLNWIHSNGPATAGLLKNLGGVLKAFAPGLSSVGSLELRLVSDFLGVLAKTPKSVAKPLVDVAGALLLLQKTGVLKVGIKLVGTAAKLLSGGAISVGGGAAAAGEIRAAFASGGAAAAAEIRAALAGGAAAGGAGGIGGGAAAGATAGKAAGGGFLTAFRAAISPAVGGVLIGALIRAVGDSVSPAGSFAGNLNKQFQADGHLWSTSLLHSFTFGGLEGWLTSRIGLPVGAFLNNLAGGAKTWGGNVTKTVVGAFGNIAGGAKTWWGNITGTVSRAWGSITGSSQSGSKGVQNAFGSAGRAADALRTQQLTPLQRKVADNTGEMLNLAGTITGHLRPAFGSGSTAADAFRAGGLARLRTQLQHAGADVQTVQRFINAMHGKTVNVNVSASGSGGILVQASGLASRTLRLIRQFASGGFVHMGTGPASDDVPAMLSRGELVVPARMVRAGAVDHLRGALPGFASGGIVGLPSWAGSQEGSIVGGWSGQMTQAMVSAMIKAIQAAAAKAAAAVGALGGPTSASAAQAQAYARSRLGAYGWGAAQMTPLIRLWNQESGWNRFARNPSSGAYGIPQSLPASKMGAAANPPTSSAAAQINWGLGYIRGRYGSPAGAWGHEVAYNWYDRGGLLKPGLTLAYNGTGRPEQVVPAGGAAGGGGVHLHLTVNGPIGSQQQLEDWYVRTANKLAQHGRLTQAVKTASR